MAAELSHVGPSTPVLHQPKPAKVLAQCFNPFFAVMRPSILKTVTVQSNFRWTALMIPHILPYFQPVVPLLKKIRQELIIPIRQEGEEICANQKFSHDDFIDAIVTMLSELPDSCWLAKEAKKGSVTLPQSRSALSATSTAPQFSSTWSFPTSCNPPSPMFTLSNDPLPWLPPIHTSSKLSSQSSSKHRHQSQDMNPCLGKRHTSADQLLADATSGVSSAAGSWAKVDVSHPGFEEPVPTDDSVFE